MTIVRQYRMEAMPGRAAETRAGFAPLIAAFTGQPGFHGATLLRDIEEPHRFVMLQRWDSIEAHRTASAGLTREAIGPLLATLTGLPDGMYLEYLDA